MKTITLATQKGGSGKSTLAASLAVAALADGFRVAALDTDPQQSLARWGKRRDSQTPMVRGCEPHELEKLLTSLRANYDLCLVDTAGAHNTSVAPALMHADFCLVPVKPTMTDLEAAIPTAKQLADRKKHFAFVLSQCFGSTARLNDASAGLLRYGEVAACNIFQRVDYPDAQTGGQGVTEYNANGSAAKEIRLLWAWLRRAAEVTK